MSTDSRGKGMALAGAVLVLILLPLLPLTLLVVAFVHLRDWLESRAESQAVPNA